MWGGALRGWRHAIFVFLALGVAGCRREAKPEITVMIALPIGPFQWGQDQLQFLVRNETQHTFWVPAWPAFRATAERGDFVLRITHASGQVVPHSCLIHEGVGRNGFAPLLAGETRSFPYKVPCFSLKDQPLGRYKLEATYRPLATGCAPPPGAKCFSGEARAMVRFALREDGMVARVGPDYSAGAADAAAD